MLCFGIISFEVILTIEFTGEKAEKSRLYHFQNDTGGFKIPKIFVFTSGSYREIFFSV